MDKAGGVVYARGMSNSRRFARISLGLLLLINLVNYIDRYILAAVIVPVQDELLKGDAAADEKMGYLQTAFLVSYMIFSPLFGVLGDRMRRWVIIGIGVILWSLASGASGLAHTYMLLLFTRIFVGIGEAAYAPLAPTLISDLYPVAERGKVMSFFYMAIPVGSAIGYAVGGLAHKYATWHWGFYLMAIPGLLLGAWALFMREPQREVQQVQHKATMQDYLALLKIPSYIFNCIGMTALTFAIGGIAYWMPKYIYAFRKAGSLEDVSMTFGAITVVTGFTATLAGGIVADKLRTKVRGAYFMVSAISLALAFPFFIGVLYLPFPLAWVAIFMAEFLIFFNTGPSNTALANVTSPSVRATAFAMNIFIIHLLGDAISPPIIGRITDRFDGNMNAGFVAVGAVMLIGAAAWFVGAYFLDRDTARAGGTGALPCPKCGHDLKRNTDPVCPKCGAPNPAAPPMH